MSYLTLKIFSGLAPSQGGRYAGFGNTIDQPKSNNDNDFFNQFSSVRITFFIV